MNENTPNPGNEKPISLHPLTPENALERLMQVKPAREDTMSLGPKKSFRLTAICTECGHEVNKDVEVEQINLQTEQLRFTGEAARQHQQHPDLNHFRVTAVEL